MMELNLLRWETDIQMELGKSIVNLLKSLRDAVAEVCCNNVCDDGFIVTDLVSCGPIESACNDSARRSPKRGVRSLHTGKKKCPR